MPQSTTTVALVADTHGFLDPRIAGIARAADLVVHAGDIGGQAILDTLARDGARVIAVAGNVDDARHWPRGEAALLERLPTRAEAELPGGRLVVEHGHRFAARSRHRRLRAAHADAAAVVCGHSHRRVIDRDALPWILNPGAAGRSRPHDGPGCLLLHAAATGWELEVHRFESLPARR